MKENDNKQKISLHLPCEKKKKKKKKSKGFIPYLRLVIQKHPHNIIAFYISWTLLILFY
jgi:hypothetical protein